MSPSSSTPDRPLHPKWARRAAVVAVGVAAVVPVTHAGTAGAKTVKQPGQTVTQTLKDGTRITITRTQETARISPSMGGTPLHRNALVSGRYDLTASDPKASVSVAVGYIVACQLTFGGNATGQSTGTASNYNPENATVTAQAGGGVTLGPGQAANYVIYDVGYKDTFGAQAHTSTVAFDGGRGSAVYRNQSMMVNGCAGYAQARAYATAYVTTDAVSQSISLYGKPFSLG